MHFASCKSHVELGTVSVFTMESGTVSIFTMFSSLVGARTSIYLDEIDFVGVRCSVAVVKWYLIDSDSWLCQRARMSRVREC